MDGTRARFIHCGRKVVFRSTGVSMRPLKYSTNSYIQYSTLSQTKNVVLQREKLVTHACLNNQDMYIKLDIHVKPRYIHIVSAEKLCVWKFLIMVLRATKVSPRLNELVSWVDERKRVFRFDGGRHLLSMIWILYVKTITHNRRQFRVPHSYFDVLRRCMAVYRKNPYIVKEPQSLTYRFSVDALTYSTFIDECDAGAHVVNIVEYNDMMREFFS